MTGTWASTNPERASAWIGIEGGGSLGLRVGQEIRQQVRLAEIHEHYVILSHPLGRWRLELDSFPSPRGAAIVPALHRPEPAAVPPVMASRVATSDAAVSALDALRATLPSQPDEVILPPVGGLALDASTARSMPAALELHEGDQILRVDGERVASAAHLQLLLGAASEGSVRLEVQRGAVTRSYVVSR